MLLGGYVRLWTRMRRPRNGRGTTGCALMSLSSCRKRNWRPEIVGEPKQVIILVLILHVKVWPAYFPIHAPDWKGPNVFSIFTRGLSAEEEDATRMIILRFHWYGLQLLDRPGPSVPPLCMVVQLFLGYTHNPCQYCDYYSWPLESVQAQEFGGNWTSPQFLSSQVRQLHTMNHIRNKQTTRTRVYHRIISNRILTRYIAILSRDQYTYSVFTEIEGDQCVVVSPSDA